VEKCRVSSKILSSYLSHPRRTRAFRGKTRTCLFLGLGENVLTGEFCKLKYF